MAGNLPRRGKTPKLNQPVVPNTELTSGGSNYVSWSEGDLKPRKAALLVMVPQLKTLGMENPISTNSYYGVDWAP